MSETIKFSELGIKAKYNHFVGEKIKVQKILNVQILVHDYQIRPSKYPEKGYDNYLQIQITYENKKYVVFTVSKILMEMIKLVPKDKFPFITKIVNNNDSYEFS